MSGVPYLRLFVFMTATISQSVSDDPIANFDNVQVWDCNPGIRQRWEISHSSYPQSNIFLQSDGKVLDILGYSNDTGGNLQVTTHLLASVLLSRDCEYVQVFSKTNTPWNQQFLYNESTNQIVSLMNGRCAEGAGSANTSGTNVDMAPCSNGKNQMFVYNKTDMTFRYGINSMLCLDAGSSANCSVAPNSGYPYCNSSLDAKTRVDDLVSRMTLEEKVRFSHTHHKN